MRFASQEGGSIAVAFMSEGIAWFGPGGFDNTEVSDPQAQELNGPESLD